MHRLESFVGGCVVKGARGYLLADLCNRSREDGQVFFDLWLPRLLPCDAKCSICGRSGSRVCGI